MRLDRGLFACQSSGRRRKSTHAVDRTQATVRVHGKGADATNSVVDVEELAVVAQRHVDRVGARTGVGRDAVTVEDRQAAVMAD